MEGGGACECEWRVEEEKEEEGGGGRRIRRGSARSVSRYAVQQLIIHPRMAGIRIDSSNR